jgi:hypothetical protein
MILQNSLKMTVTNENNIITSEYNFGQSFMSMGQDHDPFTSEYDPLISENGLLSSEYDPLNEITMNEVTNLSNKRRRHSYTLEKKQLAIAELKIPGVKYKDVAEKYGVTKGMISVWKRLVEKDNDSDAKAKKVISFRKCTQVQCCITPSLKKS